MHPIVSQIFIVIANSNKNFNLCWVPSHIGVRQNENADEAAQAATREEPENSATPKEDNKILIRNSIRQRWQQQWQNIQPNNNKLRLIKETTTAFKTSYFKDRQWERIVCWIRLGHTQLTHKHLMERSQPPLCENCIVPLTVYHILIECPDYQQQRQMFGTHSNDIRFILQYMCEYQGPFITT